MKNVIAICFLFFYSVTSACTDNDKFELFDKIEKCQELVISTSNLQKTDSVCEYIQKLVIDCTKDLGECYEDEEIDKMRENYLETLIMDTWADLLSLDQLSLLDKLGIMNEWNNPNNYIINYANLELGFQNFDFEKTKPIGMNLSKCKSKMNGSECRVEKLWTKQRPLKSLKKDVFNKCKITKKYFKKGTGHYGPFLTCHKDEYLKYFTCYQKEYENLVNSKTYDFLQLGEMKKDDTFSVPKVTVCRALDKIMNNCINELKYCTDSVTLKQFKKKVLDAMKKPGVLFVRPSEVDCPVLGNVHRKSSSDIWSYTPSKVRTILCFKLFQSTFLLFQSYGSSSGSYTTTYTIIPIGLILSFIGCMIKVFLGCFKESEGGQLRRQSCPNRVQEAENPHITITNITDNPYNEVYNESVETENEQNPSPPSYEEFMKDEEEKDLPPPKYENT